MFKQLDNKSTTQHSEQDEWEQDPYQPVQFGEAQEGTFTGDSHQFSKGQKVFLHHSNGRGLRWISHDPNGNQGAYAHHSDYKVGRWKKRKTTHTNRDKEEQKGEVEQFSSEDNSEHHDHFDKVIKGGLNRFYGKATADQIEDHAKNFHFNSSESRKLDSDYKSFAKKVRKRFVDHHEANLPAEKQHTKADYRFSELSFQPKAYGILSAPVQFAEEKHKHLKVTNHGGAGYVVQHKGSKKYLAFFRDKGKFYWADHEDNAAVHGSHEEAMEAGKAGLKHHDEQMDQYAEHERSLSQHAEDNPEFVRYDDSRINHLMPKDMRHPLHKAIDKGEYVGVHWQHKNSGQGITGYARKDVVAKRATSGGHKVIPHQKPNEDHISEAEFNKRYQTPSKGE